MPSDPSTLSPELKGILGSLTTFLNKSEDIEGHTIVIRGSNDDFTTSMYGNDETMLKILATQIISIGEGMGCGHHRLIAKLLEIVSVSPVLKEPFIYRKTEKPNEESHVQSMDEKQVL